MPTSRKRIEEPRMFPVKHQDKSEWREPKHGDMRIWHNPQIPGKSFVWPVASIEEAAKMLELLAHYDGFLLNERHRVDYSNCNGLVVWDSNLDPDEDGERWTDWESEDGESIDDLEPHQWATAKWCCANHTPEQPKLPMLETV